MFSPMYSSLCWYAADRHMTLHDLQSPWPRYFVVTLAARRETQEFR